MVCVNMSVFPSTMQVKRHFLFVLLILNHGMNFATQENEQLSMHPTVNGVSIAQANHNTQVHCQQ